MENKSKGIILMLLSSLLFAFMAASVKATGNIPLAEKIFFRNILGFLIALYLVKKNKKSILGNDKKFLLLRSLCGLLGVAGYFFALSKMPLADTVILNRLSPFFVLIFSGIFLKEKVEKHQLFALILAFIGAGFIIKPQFNMSMLPALIALISALFAGAAYTVIRHLRLTDSPETIILYFTAISSIITLPFMIFGGFVIPNSYELLQLLLLGVFATTAQFLMTNSYRHAPAGELSIYSYANILFSALIGVIIWSEIPDNLSMVGGITILIAGYINYYYGNRVNKNSINN